MDKSPDACRTISEVAQDLDVPQHVLRFWESRFPQVKPMKRGGGRRYYRPDDVDLLRGIRHLLYGEGYTIKGVQRILKEDGARFVQSVGRGEQVAPRRTEEEDGDPAEEGDEDRAEDEDEEADTDADDDPVAAAEEPAATPRPATAASEPREAPQHGALHADAPSCEAAAASPALSTADAERLRAVLEELEECDRVLSALSMAEEAAASDEAID